MYEEGRPERLKAFLDQRQPEAIVEIKPFKLQTTEVTWQQIADWLNTLWFVHRIEEPVGKPRILHRYIVDWHGTKLLDDYPDRPSPCGVERDGLGYWRAKPGCELRPVELIFPMAAQSYCAAIGGHVMTSEEYEYAARKATDRKYPWGDEPPQCSRSVFDQQSWTSGYGAPECARELPHAEDVRRLHVQDITEDGIRDLFDNVTEITSTRYISKEEPNTLKTTYYVIRGTSYLSIREMGIVSVVARMPSNEARLATGFRCAF
jgi:formylglycine-generating enzyme required for sulfatase activity